jgi:Anti-sigma-K factor rskA/Putative zinc-finger
VSGPTDPSRYHELVEDLLGAYVLDAVEPEERALVDDHLSECARCRAEVAELREAATLLAHSGPAPEGVWDRIAASLEPAPPPLRLDVRRRPWRAVTLAALATAAAVLIGVLVVQVRGQHRDIDRLEQAIADQRRTVDVEAAAAAALAEPGSRVARLATDAGKVEATAVLRATGEGYLLGTNLPPLSGRIYQLWGATDGGRIVSLGVLAQPGPVAFAGDPTVQVLMMTEEQAPAEEPTSAPVLQGSLT